MFCELSNYIHISRVVSDLSLKPHPSKESILKRTMNNPSKKVKYLSIRF